MKIVVSQDWKVMHCYLNTFQTYSIGKLLKQTKVVESFQV